MDLKTESQDAKYPTLVSKKSKFTHAYIWKRKESDRERERERHQHTESAETNSPTHS